MSSPRKSGHNGWTKATVELMLGLKTSSNILAFRYEKASQWYYKAHNLTSIPLIILMSIIGSSTFTTLSDNCTQQTVWGIIAGSINILAAIMTAVNTFMDFRAKGVLCRTSYTGFTKLNTDILRMLMLRPVDRVPYSKFSMEVFTTYNSLLTDAPTLIDKFKHMTSAPEDDTCLDMDGYCVYVQSKKHSGLGGGLQMPVGKTPRDKIKALNFKLSTVGLDSLGTTQLRNMVPAEYSSSGSGDAVEINVES